MKTVKFLLSVFLLVCLSGSTFAQKSGEGIDFFEGTWEEALAMAKKENKTIFLDGYASWCGPCKKMIKEIFPQESVGEFYNKNFINVKMDMEKGEGPMVAEKYNIQRYPTFVYINADGEALHRAAGYKPAEEFIADGTDAMDTNKQFYSLKKRYEGGEKDKTFLMNAFNAAYKALDRGLLQNIANDLGGLLTKKDLKSMDMMKLVMNAAPFSDQVFDFMMNKKHKKKLLKKMGTEKLTNTVAGVMKQRVYNAAGAGNEKGLTDALAYVKANMPDQAEKLNGSLEMLFHQKSKNWAKFATVASTWVDKFAMEDWTQLNSVAWTFYEQVEDAKLLAQALKWAKKSVALDKNYYNTDTQAALHYKLGEKKEALKMAKVAVALAKADGSSADETLQLIEKINSELANKDIEE